MNYLAAWLRRALCYPTTSYEVSKSNNVNAESCGELTLVRLGGLNTEAELLDELVLK